MANEKVTLKIGGDTSELEKSFSALIKKIQTDADRLKLTPGAEAGKGAAATVNNIERNLARQKAALDMYNRELSKQRAELEKIIQLEKRGIDQLGERQRAEERLNRQRLITQTQQVNYDRAMDQAKKSMGVTPAGGGGMDIGAAVKSLIGSLSVATAIKAAVNEYTFSSRAPAAMNLGAGAAIQSGLGQYNKSILSGDLVSQTLLQNQMGSARDIATKEFDRTHIQDYLLSKPRALLGFDEKSKYFDIERARQINENAQKQAQASLEQNQPLMLAQGFFGQTFDRNLGAERALGLGTDQFKQMQLGMNNKGFLTDQATGLLGQVQGAGGSASGAQGGNIAGLGLEMQRAFNLTNSGGTLGKLTGLYGSGSAASFGKVDDASKRILEEAITKGFDRSENTEILRKFTETSASIIYKGEGKTASDIEMLTRGFSQLLSGSPTMKQFDAASGAYDRYQSLTSQTAGRGGSFGFAAMAQNKNFSKLSTLQMGNLMGLSDDRLTSTNSDIVAAAVQQGISPEMMVSELKKAKQTQALGTLGLSSKQMGSLKGYLGNRDISSLIGNTEELTKMKASNPQAYEAFQNLQNRADLDNKSGSDEEKRAMMKQLYLGPAFAQGAGTTGAATAKLATGTAGKTEETFIAAQAAQEKQMVLNLKALEDQLMPTAKSISELTRTIIQLGNAAKLLNQEQAGILHTEKRVQTVGSMGRTPANGSKPQGGSQ